MKKIKSNDDGFVFSTNPDFEYDTPSDEVVTLPPAQQKLKVSLDKKGRGGKTVTLIEGFVGTADDLDALAKQLKTKCGTGGSSKDGEILIQGDVRQKVTDFLKKEGYKVR